MAQCRANQSNFRVVQTQVKGQSLVRGVNYTKASFQFPWYYVRLNILYSSTDRGSPVVPDQVPEVAQSLKQTLMDDNLGHPTPMFSYLE